MRRIKKRRIRHLIVAAIVAVFCFICVVMLLPSYRSYREDVYDVLSSMDENAFIRSGNTVIYDENDELIGKIGYENYEYVTISKISKYIKDGYIAVEDKNFKTHHGVDIRATLRAGLHLIRNRGEITQGGSTITQQVVKNSLLTQEKTFKRKILEIFLALEIEKRFDKAQIMEFYCNSNYYGHNCYGVEGASEYYFGKHASDVTLAEAAILVGTSNSPNNYNPETDYKLATEKKIRVLDRMLEQGYISQKEYDVAVKEEPVIVKKTMQAESDSYQISYAVHCTALKLMEKDGFEFQYTFHSQKDCEDYKDSYKKIYSEYINKVRTGGYSIYTSFDSGLQKKLQQAVDSGLAEFEEKQEDGRYEMQGAAVCIDNETQMVVAIVGGRGTNDSYNRAYQSERQPGSVIKPLLDYGPALDQGVALVSSYYEDTPLNINGYKPKNADSRYRGSISLREALARSVNTVAVQLFMDTGKDTAMSYLEKMHFDSMQYEDMLNLGVSIGGFYTGVSVDDMAKGYATLANGGRFMDNGCIRSISDYSGKKIWSSKTDHESVYNEDTAFILTDMLQGVFKESYGTAHEYDTNEQDYAGKTGTTNDNNDAWFCGYSPYYTTAVWTGCDIPKSVDGLYGNTYPAEIWNDFMEQIHDGLEKKLFDIPETIVLQDKYGNKKHLSYEGYESRPFGYDYTSLILAQKYLDNQQKKEQDELNKKAEQKVLEFEEYQITCAEDAITFDEKYNAVLEIIEDLSDLEERQKLMQRIAYKYDLLSKEVIDRWKDAQEQVEKDAQEIRDRENEEEAQASLETADRRNRQSLRDKANWYIDHLNMRTLYTDYSRTLIEKGADAVEACKDLSDYQDIKSRYDDAVEKVKKLPEKVMDEPLEDDYPVETPADVTFIQSVVKPFL